MEPEAAVLPAHHSNEDITVSGLATLRAVGSVHLLSSPSLLPWVGFCLCVCVCVCVRVSGKNVAPRRGFIWDVH